METAFVERTGLIFNIQRYSIEDGPGIRTTVFLKGCLLECLWCSNPESQRFYPEIAYMDSLCNKCGRCIELCAEKAISINSKGVHINRKSCTNCGKCIEVCSPQALKVFGKEMTVQEVFHEIQADIQYYLNSLGGITVSGGEPLYQPDFTVALLKRCRDEGINTCLDTSGYGDPAALEEVLAYTSLVLFDLKHMNPAAHLKLTRRSNRQIIRNLELTVAAGIPLIIRIPLIPGLNNSDEELMATGRFLAGMKGVKKVQFLPYHTFGMGKYKMLDRRYKLSELGPPTDKELQRAKEILVSSGINFEVIV
jgi:pyruvate formate lyase activating enzyme